MDTILRKLSASYPDGWSNPLVTELVRLLTINESGVLTKLEDFEFVFHLTRVFPKWDEQFAYYIEKFGSKTPKETLTLAIHRQLLYQPQSVPIKSLNEACLDLLERLGSMEYLNSKFGEVSLDAENPLAFICLQSSSVHGQWEDLLFGLVNRTATVTEMKDVFKTIPILQIAGWNEISRESVSKLIEFLKNYMTEEGLCILLGFDGERMSNEKVKEVAAILAKANYESGNIGKFMDRIPKISKEQTMQIMLWYVCGRNPREGFIEGAKSLFGMENLKKILAKDLILRFGAGTGGYKWKDPRELLDYLLSQQDQPPQRTTQDLIKLLKSDDYSYLQTKDPKSLTYESLLESLQALADTKPSESQFIHAFVRILMNSDWKEEELILKLTQVLDKLADLDNLPYEVFNLASQGRINPDQVKRLAEKFIQ